MSSYKSQANIKKFVTRDNKRTVIIHRHLFKNAGTTFDSILQRNCGRGFCDHRDDVPMRKIGPQYLIQYLTDHPQISALSSHHIWFNMPKHRTLELVPVMFLRHPVERMRSVYNFERKQQSDTLGSKMARSLSFREYVLWRMKDDTPATIRDFHTRHLVGIKTIKPMEKKHFEMAREEILNNPLIGVVELFDRSLLVFKKALKDKGIDLELSYHPKNVSRPFEDKDYDQSIREVLNDLGESTKIVLKKNTYDLELYKIVKEKIEKEAQDLIINDGTS